MTPREARYALADQLRGAVPDGWTVYPGPPGGVNAPAVAIIPRTPYRVTSTVGICEEEVRLSLVVLIQQVSGLAGLDTLDDVATSLRDAVDTGALMAVVDDVSEIAATQEIGGVDYLAATLNVTCQV